MKFWQAACMIDNVEETRLIAADKNYSKSKVLKTLQEVHPEWVDLKLTRARKTKGWSYFER